MLYFYLNSSEPKNTTHHIINQHLGICNVLEISVLDYFNLDTEASVRYLEFDLTVIYILQERKERFGEIKGWD